MQEIAVALALGLALACVFGITIITVIWLEHCGEPEQEKQPTAADILERKEKRK